MKTTRNETVVAYDATGDQKEVKIATGEGDLMVNRLKKTLQVSTNVVISRKTLLMILEAYERNSRALKSRGKALDEKSKLIDEIFKIVEYGEQGDIRDLLARKLAEMESVHLRAAHHY